MTCQLCPRWRARRAAACKAWRAARRSCSAAASQVRTQLRARGVLVLGLPARGLGRRASTGSPDHHPLDQPTPGPAGRCPWTGSGVLAVLTRLEMLIRIDAYRDDEVSRASLEPAYALVCAPSAVCHQADARLRPGHQRPPVTQSPAPLAPSADPGRPPKSPARDAGPRGRLP